MSGEPLLSRQFNLAFLASMFYGISFAVFVHIAGFFVGIGADEPRVGLILGLGSIGGLIIRPALGTWLDRFGRKRFAILGAMVKGRKHAPVLNRQFRIRIWPIVVVFFHSISEALLYTSMATVGADVVPASRRTEGLALFGVSGQAPLAIGGILGDLLIRVGGFELLFVASALLAVAALLIIFLLEEPAPRNVGARTSVWKVFSRPRLRPLWYVAFSFAMALTVFFVFLRTFVDETGIGSVGLFFVLYSGTAITLRDHRTPGAGSVWRRANTGRDSGIAGDCDGGVGDGGLSADIGRGGSAGGNRARLRVPDHLVLGNRTCPRRRPGNGDQSVSLMFPIGSLVGAPIGGYLIKIAGYSGMFLFFAALVAVMAVAFKWNDSRLSPAVPG